MKYFSILLIFLSYGCSIRFETPRDYYEDEFYFNKKVNRIIITNNPYHEYLKDYKTKSIDTITFDSKNNIIKTIHVDFSPGCYEESFVSTSYLDSQFHVFASIYNSERSNQLSLTNYSGQNKTIDSLINNGEYTKIYRMNWSETKNGIKKTYHSNSSKQDSTVYIEVYKDRKLIQDVYIRYHRSLDKHYSDTMNYQYPNINKRIELNGDVPRQEIIVYPNKTIILRKGIDNIKSVYKTRKGFRKEHLEYENDRLKYKVIYQYSNGFLIKELHYKYELSKRVTKTETLTGKMWDGHDSIPKFRIHDYDSTYYNYNVVPDITTYEYQFEK